MKAGRHELELPYSRLGTDQPVQASDQFLKHYLAGIQADVRNLVFGMNAGIGASLAGYRYRALEQYPKGLFQLSLYRTKPRMALPSMEGRSIIFQNDFEWGKIHL